MSWLNDYEQEKRAKENENKQRLSEEDQRKDMKERERKEHCAQSVQKAKELSSMVASLLDDIGKVEYGENKLLNKKYSIETHIRIYAGSYPCDTYWQLLDRRDDGICVCLEESEGKFVFSVHGEKTQDIGRSDLQSLLRKKLKDGTAFEDLEIKEYRPDWD